MEYIYKFTEDYIDKMMANNRFGANPDQANLVNRYNYQAIYYQVADILHENPDLSIDELRQKLFEISGLEEAVRIYVEKEKFSPSISLSYGTSLYKENISLGSKNGSQSIYDLASITKLFTSISIMKLVSDGLINLDDEICYYLPEYKNLEHTTIYDLLTFQVPLLTNGRIENAKDQAQAEDILKTARVWHEFNQKNPYTDIGAMILKYLIEKVTNMKFYDYIKDTFLDKFGLIDTHVTIPESKISRAISTSDSIKILDGGNVVVDNGPKLGVPHDGKARIMESDSPNLSGHAGLFSTTVDLSNLCISLIKGTILDPEIVNGLSRNEVGGKHIFNSENVMAQYFGKLCYSKNPHPGNTEVKHELSGVAFASAGFTGNKLFCDPINDLYMSLLSSRVNDSVIYVHPSMQDKLISDNGPIRYKMPNQEEKVYTAGWAYTVDNITDRIVYLTMQYKFLEEYFGIDKYKENTITL